MVTLLAGATSSLLLLFLLTSVGFPELLTTHLGAESSFDGVTLTLAVMPEAFFLESALFSGQLVIGTICSLSVATMLV